MSCVLFLFLNFDVHEVRVTDANVQWRSRLLQLLLLLVLILPVMVDLEVVFAIVLAEEVVLFSSSETFHTRET